MAKWGRTCSYCGASGVGAAAVPLNIDHIHPRSRGGSNRVSNLVLACIPCNQIKGARTVEEFLGHDPGRLAKVLAQAKAPLGDAAAVNTTRWALYRQLQDSGLPVKTSSGGRTKWNRTQAGLAKTHTLDALCVGEVDRVVSTPEMAVVAKATGRGTYQRVNPDKFGFPRGHKARTKAVYGFVTGNLVRAVVPSGKHTGTHGSVTTTV